MSYLEPTIIRFAMAASSNVGTQASNFAANLAPVPIAIAPGKLTITNFVVVTNLAYAPADVNTNIKAYLINISAPTTPIGTIWANSANPMTVNTAFVANLNTTAANVAKGTVLGLYMAGCNVANAVWGSAGCYLITYVQGSPASEM